MGSVASRQTVVDFLIGQMQGAGAVTARKMFGEYGIFLDGRMVALVCDDQLFVKPTNGGRAFAGHVDEASPYPGAKPCLLIPEDRWEDQQWLAQLILLSAAELPLPKAKKTKRT